MTPERIEKIREHALRGEGEEKKSARAILTKLGIPWERPKESIIDRMKTVFGGNIKHRMRFSILKSTDILLIQTLVNVFIDKNRSIMMENNDIYIQLTAGEYHIMCKLYNDNNRASFQRSMIEYAHSKVELDFKI